MRIFAVSDIHIDYDGNARWLSNLSASEYTDDVLILAGDVSDDPRLLEQCFKTLSDRFRQVLYVPGNHDLWVLRWDRTKTSFDKYRLIDEMTRGFGVLMKPYTHGTMLSALKAVDSYLAGKKARPPKGLTLYPKAEV